MINKARLDHSRRVLRPFQSKGVTWGAATLAPGRGILIADEPGLGKTAQALHITHVAEVGRTLVVTPASLKLNWEREIAKWLPGSRVQVVMTGYDDIRPDTDFTVINYELVWRRYAFLKEQRYQGIIFDEMHYLRGESSMRTTVATELVKPIPYRIGLTGTPIINRPAELVPQLRILGRLWLDDHQFKHRYCGPAQVWNGHRMVWEFRGHSNLDDLHEHLRAFAIRREKAAVAPELPRKQRTVLPVTLGNMAQYRRAEEEYVAWAEKNADALRMARGMAADEDWFLFEEKPPTAGQLGRLQGEQFRHLAKLRRLIAQGKRKLALEWIKSFLPTGQKLLVFALTIEVQEALRDAFHGCASILGEYSQRKRMEQVDRFQTDPSCQLMVASLKAAAEGLTLTAANNVLVVELPWAPTHLEQAEDRTHRIGQTLPVNVWLLVAAGTLEERILEILDRKQQVADRAVDGRSTTEILTEMLRSGKGSRR